MRSSVTAVLALSTAAGSLPAQAIRGVEVGVAGAAVFSDPAFVGAGPLFALRPGGRARVSLAVVPGAITSRLALRGELTGQFLLTPGLVHGLGLYGQGGVAGVAGAEDRAFLVLGLGIETNPAGRSGWMIEAGVGGGARLVIGWRRRWLGGPAAAPP